MSWRDILGVGNSIKDTSTHNTQYTQYTHKASKKSNSANNANCAEVNSKLLEALATACDGLTITPNKVKKALATEYIEAWFSGEISIETLTGFAHALQQRQDIDQGKRPAHFTYKATCNHCGPIWLWCAGDVMGCPWCWNRATGRPIPRPETIRCADCEHFKRIDHPHLGHCQKGEPEAIAGLWDSDQRHCDYYAIKQKPK